MPGGNSDPRVRRGQGWFTRAKSLRGGRGEHFLNPMGGKTFGRLMCRVGLVSPPENTPKPKKRRHRRQAKPKNDIVVSAHSARRLGCRPAPPPYFRPTVRSGVYFRLLFPTSQLRSHLFKCGRLWGSKTHRAFFHLFHQLQFQFAS